MQAAFIRFFRQPSVWHVTVLIAVWLLVFWRYITPEFADRVTFPDGDFTQQFFIYRDLAYRQLAMGDWPWWVSCFFGGYPFHADPQSQLFYPPVWVSFGVLKLLGYGHFPLFALVLEVIAHYLLTAGFMYLWLREEVGRGDAALIGALLFAFGGYLMGYPPLQSAILETVTWLPLLLWLLRRLALQGGLRWLAVAAVVLAVAFLAGHPQTLLLVAYLALAYFVWVGRGAERSWRWLAGHLAGFYALVGLLVAVQLLPQAQFLMLSTRTDLGYDALASGFNPADVVQLFVTELVSRWQPMYLTIFGLTLVVLGVIHSGHRNIRFWVWLGLAGLVLSLGAGSAGYPLAYWLLPGYSLFRGQERAVLWFAFAGCVLAAHGAVWLLNTTPQDEKVTQARRWLRNLMPFAVLLLVASLFAAQSGLGDWGHLPARFGLLLIGLVLAFLALREPRYQMPIILAVLVVELYSANARTNQVRPFDAYPYTPLLDVIQVDAATGRWFRVQDDARMQGHWACGYGLNEWGGISPIRLASWAEFDERVPEVLRWQALGIDYVISWRDELYTREGAYMASDVVYEGNAPLGPAKVHALHSAPQRAWLVGNLIQVADTDALYVTLNAPRFDLNREAVTTADIGGSMLGVGGGVVQVVADRPGHMQFQVNLPEAGLLVVSEAYYPGWQTDLPGAAVISVNGYLLGVVLPAGDYTLTLTYRPSLLGWGAGLSGLGLIVAAGLWGWRRQT